MDPNANRPGAGFRVSLVLSDLAAVHLKAWVKLHQKIRTAPDWPTPLDQAYLSATAHALMSELTVSNCELHCAEGLQALLDSSERLNGWGPDTNEGDDRE